MGKKDELVRRVEGYAKLAAQAMDELEVLESFPEEPTNDPAILYFQKRFGDGSGSPHSKRHGKKYDYVAVKAGDGLWYLSGPMKVRGQTWDELVEFMSTGVDEVWVVTDLERLF